MAVWTFTTLDRLLACFLPLARSDAIFGTSLSELAERTGSPVPKFMFSFMEHIEKKYLEVVGLYRLSGNAAMVQKLRYQVEQGEAGFFSLSTEANFSAPFAVIKSYFLLLCWVKFEYAARGGLVIFPLGWVPVHSQWVLCFSPWAGSRYIASGSCVFPLG